VSLVTGQPARRQFIDLLATATFVSRVRGRSRCRLDLSYKVQVEAGGIAQVGRMARDFAAVTSSWFGLGDNIFEHAHAEAVACGVTAVHWSSSRMCGPRELRCRRLRRRDERHRHRREAGRVDLRFDAPPSSDAVVGLYCYPPDVFEIIEGLAPSSRGELEITDVNRQYAARASSRCAASRGGGTTVASIGRTSPTLAA